MINRIIAAFLAVVIVVSNISGCDFTAGQISGIDEYFAELKCNNELIYSSDGEFSLSLSSNLSYFKDNIDNSSVKIYYTQINDELPQIDNEDGIMLSENEYTLSQITPAEIIVNSDNLVTVSFIDKSFKIINPDGYLVVFDKECTEDGKYLYAFSPVKYQVCSLISDTNQVMKSENAISVNLTLDKNSFSDTISASDVKLSGGFEGAEVLNVNRIGDNTVSVEMLFNTESKGKYGYIAIDKSAIIDCIYDAIAEIRIITPTVFVNYDNFEASATLSRIPITLEDCNFLSDVESSDIHFDTVGTEISSFDRVSATEAILYVSFNNESVEQTIEKISSGTFTISDTALNISEPLSFRIKPKGSEIMAEILSVKQNGSDFLVTAEFTVLNGDFNIINKNSFVFGNDYSKAVVNVIQLEDTRALVEFTIPKTASEETAELYGTVALKAGSISGGLTENGNVPSFPLRYSASEESLNISDAVFDADVSSSALASLATYSVNSLPSDFSAISGLFDFDRQSFLAIKNQYKYFEKLREYIITAINSDTLSDSSAKIDNARSELYLFLNELTMLDALVNSVYDNIFRLYELENEIAECSDEQEMENLIDEYNKLIALVKTAYKTKIAGKGFSVVLNNLIDTYMAEGGALNSFDYLIDCSYNWQKQTKDDKNSFRFYVTSVLANASIVSLCAMGADSDVTPENIDYISLVHRLNELSSYVQSTAFEEGESKEIFFCNTLGKDISIHIFDDLINSGGLTVTEISQLINMLPDGVTLKDELIEVGFALPRTRYLICSDVTEKSGVSAHNSMSTENNYGFSKSATVYDLSNNTFIENFEYDSYLLHLSMSEKSEPTITLSIMKKINIHSIG